MKYVISLSGGLDSTTLLSYLLYKKHDVECLSFKYPSKHNFYELNAAVNVAEFYSVNLNVMDVSTIFNLFKSNLLLGQGEIPEGHYESENMTATVVPGRNTIFASILMGYAQSMNADMIALGIHAGDHAIYPDCRPEWFKQFNKLCYQTTEKKVMLQAPFLHFSKIEIVTLGLQLETPYHLTRTCYKAQLMPCGKCGACVERREAFNKNNTTDPVIYKGIIS